MENPELFKFPLSTVIHQATPAHTEMFENFITKRQLAARLNISLSMVNKMMTQGLPHEKIGRAVRFEVNKVLRWVQRRS